MSVFQERPTLPPTQAQATARSIPPEQYSYTASVLRLLRNRSFILLLITYGQCKTRKTTTGRALVFLCLTEKWVIDFVSTISHCNHLTTVFLVVNSTSTYNNLLNQYSKVVSKHMTYPAIKDKHYHVIGVKVIWWLSVQFLLPFRSVLVSTIFNWKYLYLQRLISSFYKHVQFNWPIQLKSATRFRYSPDTSPYLPCPMWVPKSAYNWSETTPWL